MKKLDITLLLCLLGGILSAVIFEITGGKTVLDWFQVLYVLGATNIIYMHTIERRFSD
jgi:hypothetical protein